MRSRSPPSSFYRERAASAAQLAVASTLSHVREKHLEAERVWTMMADRIAEDEVAAAARKPANDF